MRGAGSGWAGACKEYMTPVFLGSADHHQSESFPGFPGSQQKKIKKKMKNCRSEPVYMSRPVSADTYLIVDDRAAMWCPRFPQSVAGPPSRPKEYVKTAHASFCPLPLTHSISLMWRYSHTRRILFRLGRPLCPPSHATPAGPLTRRLGGAVPLGFSPETPPRYQYFAVPIRPPVPFPQARRCPVKPQRNRVS